MELALNHLCQHCGSLSPGKAFCCSACEVLHQKFPRALSKVSLEAAYLDQDNFRQLYRHKDSDYQYQLFVEGLHCSSCVHLLEKLPEFDESILEARVQFSQSRLSLHVNEKFSLARVYDLLKNWGYSAQFLMPNESSSQNFKNENRKALKQIGVAAACAGNIMLFVIPNYSGLSGGLGHVFNWMSFLLFLPVLLYSAQGFYQGAWNSIRYQVINVDLPITIALWGGFILSTVNLILGRNEIYYDSTASFIFLILSARYLLKRVQQTYLIPSHLQDFLRSRSVDKEVKGEWHSVPFMEISLGDILRIKKSETLPTDVLLLDNEAVLDLSAINGESFPQNFTQGMRLAAGSTVLGKDIRVQVLTSPEQSQFSKILNELEENSLKKNSFVKLTDQLAQKLIIAVFAIAILFFVIYASIDLQTAFNRSLALIILACPCALAFGTPLTYGLALKKAQKEGVLVKNSGSFEKILAIKNVFFDKTGTLTEGRLRLTHTEPEIIDEELKSVILSLENASFHPVAFALREKWSGTKLLPVDEKLEILGQGVQGKVAGDFWSVQTLSESVHENFLGISLSKNGKLISRLYFEDPLRQDAKGIIQSLKSQGMTCHVLSGDRRERVLTTANECAIPLENCHAELYPEDKKRILQGFKNTCMIGDGANDVLCLSTADVGIGMNGSLPLSLEASDVYFLKGGLAPLQKLFSLSQRTQRILYRNLSLSLIYNFIGGILALSGFINPLVAAILMPLSSALIVISTLWGFR